MLSAELSASVCEMTSATSLLPDVTGAPVGCSVEFAMGTSLGSGEGYCSLLRLNLWIFLILNLSRSLVFMI